MELSHINQAVKRLYWNEISYQIFECSICHAKLGQLCLKTVVMELYQICYTKKVHVWVQTMLKSIKTSDSKLRKWLYNIQKNKKQPPYYQLSTALQMFTGNYRDFAGKSECRDFKIYGDCMYTCNPCNFEISTLWIRIIRGPLYLRIFD